ncbi:MAG TPA: LemA family protein [Bacteroidales bacterium]|nr:LemA family protein [Bacteroidales bacterium]HXK81304.1 LemA family protein [Bacteroidales bacterium]
MKKQQTGLGCLGTIVWGTPILAIILIILFWGIRVNNKSIEREETVYQKWAQVENTYQLRFDLIPNLMSVVKQYAEHEKATFIAVTEARSKLVGIKINSKNLTKQNIKDFEAAQQQLGNAIDRLLVVVEKYPELKANQNFIELQYELKNIEKLILSARIEYNDVVKTYNAYIRKFPRNLFAKLLGFETKGYFESNTEAAQSPKI